MDKGRENRVRGAVRGRLWEQAEVLAQDADSTFERARLLGLIDVARRIAFALDTEYEADRAAQRFGRRDAVALQLARHSLEQYAAVLPTAEAVYGGIKVGA